MANLSDFTPRELEVLRMVLAGWTKHVIALEFHLNNLYTKASILTRMLDGVWSVRKGVEVKSGPESGGFNMMALSKKEGTAHRIKWEN